MMRLARSLARSVAAAIRHDPEVERMIAAHTKSWRPSVDRFDRNRPLVLWFAVGVTTSLFPFFGTVENLLAKDSLVEANLRIVSLVKAFQTPSLDDFTLFLRIRGTGRSW
jgi:hypothetical protein